MTALTDCRFCLEKKRHVLDITSEIQSTFYLITQMKLNKLKNFSNSICFVCYKKLLAAQGYREMLVKIEEKLLATFVSNVAHSTPIQQQQQQQKYQQQQQRSLPHVSQQQLQLRQTAARLATRSQSQQLQANGGAHSNGFKRIKLTRPHSSDDDNDVSDENEDDMSLLEEIVSFAAPDTSLLLDEREHEPKFPTADVTPPDGDDRVKQEPTERPCVEIDESNSSQSQPTAPLPLKPFKCTFPGCFSSSTTLIALKKHRRRVHNIRVQKPKTAPAPPPSKAHESSMLYNQLVQATNPTQTHRCKFCNLKLRNQRVLSRHIETVHKQAKFFCTIEGCTHASTRKDNYRLHLKNYHRTLPEEELKAALDMTRDMKPIYVNKEFEDSDEEEDEDGGGGEDSMGIGMADIGADNWMHMSAAFESDMGC